MEKNYPNTLIPRYPGAPEYPYCMYTLVSLHLKNLCMEEMIRK